MSLGIDVLVGEEVNLSGETDNFGLVVEDGPLGDGVTSF